MTCMTCYYETTSSRVGNIYNIEHTQICVTESKRTQVEVSIDPAAFFAF